MTREDDHNRARYRRGCRCDLCRAANREYQRAHRIKSLGSVSVLPTPAVDTAGMGVVEAAVHGDLESVVDRPALVAGALAMARILDNPHAIPQHPAAAGQLLRIYQTLDGQRSSPRGKLALVRSMTDR